MVFLSKISNMVIITVEPVCFFFIYNIGNFIKLNVIFPIFWKLQTLWIRKKFDIKDLELSFVIISFLAQYLILHVSHIPETFCIIKVCNIFLNAFVTITTERKECIVMGKNIYRPILISSQIVAKIYNRRHSFRN